MSCHTRRPGSVIHHGNVIVRLSSVCICDRLLPSVCHKALRLLAYTPHVSSYIFGRAAFVKHRCVQRARVVFHVSAIRGRLLSYFCHVRPASVTQVPCFCHTAPAVVGFLSYTCLLYAPGFCSTSILSLRLLPFFCHTCLACVINMTRFVM